MTTDEAEYCDRLAQGFAQLVSETSTRDTLPSLNKLALSLAAQLEVAGTAGEEEFQERGLPGEAMLAAAIARGCDLLYRGEVDPGQALLLLASATETLGKAVRARPEAPPQTKEAPPQTKEAPPQTKEAPPQLPRNAAPSPQTRALAAAKYELETLFPVDGVAPKANKGGPDVTLHRLRRR